MPRREEDQTVRSLFLSPRWQQEKPANGKRSGKTAVLRRKRSAVTQELRGHDLWKMLQPERKETHGG